VGEYVTKEDHEKLTRLLQDQISHLTKNLVAEMESIRGELTRLKKDFREASQGRR
jgi:hypothetical protein